MLTTDQPSAASGELGGQAAGSYEEALTETNSADMDAKSSAPVKSWPRGGTDDRGSPTPGVAIALGATSPEGSPLADHLVPGDDNRRVVLLTFVWVRPGRGVSAACA